MLHRNRNALGILFALGSMVILLIQSPSSSAASPNDVLTIVKTDKLTYDPGEDINITITLINPTNSSIDLTCGGSPPWHISITDESEANVYGWGMWQTMMAYYSISPNETLIFNHTMTKDLPPGSYLIEGEGYDAPNDQILIKVNGTIESDSPGYDYPMIAIALISGIAIGVVVLSLIHRKRRDKQTEE